MTEVKPEAEVVKVVDEWSSGGQARLLLTYRDIPDNDHLDHYGTPSHRSYVRAMFLDTREHRTAPLYCKTRLQWWSGWSCSPNSPHLSALWSDHVLTTSRPP